MSQAIRVTLRWVQILDTLEPRFKKKGEFVFKATVSSENGGGQEQKLRIPENGHISITDNPAWNREEVNKVVFEGTVEDHLKIEIIGEEQDRFSANDVLETYHREFRGPVDNWIGFYGPGEDITRGGDDDGTDPELMDTWRVCYVIERA